jgi:hypothetical protein
MLKRTAVFIVPSMLYACATTSQIAPERLQAAESVVQEADAAVANKTSSANTYVQYAHDELGQAKQLSSAGNGDPGEMMMLRSEADAKLATAIAQQEALHAEVKDLNEKLKALQ